jgi:ABC-type branched-subunit amino acid transport system substrate-binding protein
MVVYEGSGAVSNPEVPQGAIAASKAINAAGGIRGRPVQIIACDTQSIPSNATECGLKAVSDGVLAMVGNVTIYSAQFMPLMAQHKIASIGLVPQTAADFTSPVSFPIVGGGPVTFAGLAAALAQSGAKKIVLARVDIAAAAGLAPFANAGLERFHLTMRQVPIPAGAPDMSPYAAAALKDGTDGIVVAEPGQDAVNFIIAVRELNPNVKIALGASSVSEAISALGKSGDGIMLVESDTIALKSRAEQRYERDMRAAGYTNLTDWRLNSYASVMLFENIAERLTRITAPAVFDALSHAKNIATGVTPPLQFINGGVAGVPRDFNPCVFETVITDGRQVPTTGKFENVFTGKSCPTPV